MVNADKVKKTDNKQIELVDRLNALGDSLSSFMLNTADISTSGDLSLISHSTSKSIFDKRAVVHATSVPLIQQEKLDEFTPMMLLTKPDRSFRLICCNILVT